MEVRKIHKQTPNFFCYGAPILQSTQKQVLNALMTNIKGLRLINFEQKLILSQNYSMSNPKMPI